MMESQPHRAFPLSRYFHYDNFSHYYAFGNSPAEDFLQSVSPRECRRPTILSLGCGDMRSVMFTIFKNFGIEGENSDGFKGVKFVLNDRSAAVLARNILFFYLCMNMPDDEVEQKEWIASVWSLWYNHELLPQHDRMLSRALQQLIQWSVTWQEWSNCPLGVVVKFSSPATFARIKKMWSWWSSCYFGKSVDEMKKARNYFQDHQLKTTHGFFTDREASLQKITYEDFTVVILNSGRFLYPQETITRMESENLRYLTEGTVWAEYILDLPISNPKTVVNPTLFEREDGMYTLQYCLTPYMGFNPSFQYTRTEVGRTLGKSSPLLKQLPVADTHFKSVPLLANSVQQFAMWLKATSHLMKKSSGGKLKVSILFDLDDSLNFCCSMLHHPDMYTKFGVQFDAIYTSNLFDNIHPPALVLSALPLLKATGILFTSTFKAPIRGNLENIFGFSPELFPVFLGIQCIGHDGDYSSAVNPMPYPITNHRTLFPWRRFESQPLIFEESPHAATKSLLQLCRINCNLGPLFGGSVDSFLCVLRQFLKQFKSLPSPSHPFLKSLCYTIQTSFDLKPHLVQLQTQALLHGMHLHITLTESDCPICGGQPLENYIQQFTLSLNVGGKMGVYEAPSFAIHLVKKTGELCAITSIAVNISGSKLELIFFLPKHCFSQYDVVRVGMFPTLNDECIFIGTMDCLRRSSIEFLFFREHVQQHHTEIHALGDIVKHIGNGCTFETVISMNETCQARKVPVSKLNAAECNQLKLSLGDLESNIVYPYAIDESKVHVKVSKKRNTISVTVQRNGTVFFKEKPTYFIDPSNKLVLPRLHCGTDVIEKYCKLQVQFNTQDHPLYNAKCCFMGLFKEALSGEKYFALSLQDAPDVQALVYVHDVRFSPVFASPVLDASYCFLDTKPPHLIRELSVMQNSLGRTCSIMVDDAEYKYLKGIFNFFSTLTQCALSTEKHTVALPVQKHKLWRHFDQAIMFPLYPNPANPTYQKLDRFVTAGMEQFPDNMSPSHDLSKLGEGNVNACSFCSQSSVLVTLKNCGRCHKAKYCSEECQRMHWKFHKLVCSASEWEKAEVKQESNIPQTRPYITSSLWDSSQSEGSTETATVSNTCMRCKKPATINCSCKSVSYCSKACQTLEWPQHSEKCRGQANDLILLLVCVCSLTVAMYSVLCGLSLHSFSTSSKNEPNSADFRSENTNKAASHAGNSGSTKCSRCNNPATIICSCGSVSYCSKACQNLEFPQHSKKCKQPSSDNNPSKRCKDPAADRKVSADHDDSKREPTTFLTPKCSNCSKMKWSLQRCKCCNVSYCSVECQRLHWPQHKSTCTAVKK